MSVSKGVLIASWASIITMIWLMMFDILPHTQFSWAGFIFFFLLAFFSGAMENSNKEKHK